MRADGKGLELRILSQTRTPPLPCRITLGQAIPKGKNMDLIVEKATELGVRRIVPLDTERGAAAIQPLLSERTVAQYEPGEAVRKVDKWQRVAIEAAKQCGQNWLPSVGTPLSPKAFFDSGRKFDLLLIASLQPDSRHLKTILREHGAVPLRSVLVLVGNSA